MMIKLIEVKPHTLSVDSAYVTEDNSAVAISSELSLVEEDSGYRTYEFELQGILIVNETDEWAEFECISPEIVTKPLCSFQSQLEYEEGTPIFTVENNDNIAKVFKDGETFTLWIRENQIVNKVVKSDIALFYFDNDELVGIKSVQLKL